MIKKWVNAVRHYFEPKAAVLMYHRVDELPCDPWQLAVSPAHFEQQLRVIRQKWNPISLTELAQGILSRTVPDRSVVLTFDDGYIDNFTQAKPLLEKYEIPATFFIATQNCVRQRLFWWDELQQIILEMDRLPQQLTLRIGDETVTYDFGEEVSLTPERQALQQAWVAFDGEENPTLRCTIYLALWEKIRPRPDAEQQTILARLREWSGAVLEKASDLICMTPDHIDQLSANPLFTIGAHTETHPALADHPAAIQQLEIRNSKIYLEKLIQERIQTFAYPYGSFNNETVASVEKENFTVAVTTHEGPVTKQSQPLRLNRYQVNDWSENEFHTYLTKWLGGR